MTTSQITTLARRITKAANECGSHLAGGSLAFDTYGQGGEWYSQTARPDVAILYPLPPHRVTQREVQDWLDWRGYDEAFLADVRAARAAAPGERGEAREQLRRWAERRIEHEREGRVLASDLGDFARRAREVGIEMTEVAELAGVTRQTVYTALNRKPAACPAGQP